MGYEPRDPGLIYADDKGAYHFWDETRANSIGPFATVQNAKNGLGVYCELLSAESEAEGRELWDELRILFSE